MTDMFGNIDVAGYIFIFDIVAAIALYFYIKKGMAKADKKEGIATLEAARKYEELKIERDKESGIERVKSILGTGSFNCMCIKQGQILDWTTIPAPMGELYQADTSCPVSGGIYIVKELADGTIVDYDPREVPVKLEESPEWAWYATHWDIVPRVFSVQMSLWKSPSTWFAGALIAVLFICFLSVVGG